MGPRRHQSKVHLYLKIKPFCFDLFMQFADSDTGLIIHACYFYSTVTHNYAFTFSKILMVIIKSHAHTHSIILSKLPNSSLKCLSNLLRRIKVKEQNWMWCGNQNELQKKYLWSILLWLLGEGVFWDDSMMVKWIGSVTHNVPIYQLNLNYISTPLLLHCS